MTRQEATEKIVRESDRLWADAIATYETIIRNRLALADKIEKWIDERKDR